MNYLVLCLPVTVAATVLVLACCVVSGRGEDVTP